MSVARFQVDFVQTAAAVTDGSSVRAGEVLEMQGYEALASRLDRR
jgi:hypothetical protein